MHKFKIGDKVTHSKLTGVLTVIKTWVQPASTVPGATWDAFACYRLVDRHGEDFTTSEEECMTLEIS